ncbi:MAG: flagellar basal body P-ring formation protein FlgA [Acidobacteria bacterium]|nr:flagellar basal body P-ring formation protein FlgA [Acidobacteriota bacterium]
MTRTLTLLILSPAALVADCIQVDRLQVHASDLAAVLPAFGSLPAGTVLGYTPAPGLRRFWTLHQLNTILERHGLPVLAATNQPDATICVERPARTYSAQEVEKALRTALPQDAHLELIDYCRLPMPSGDLRFELKSLSSHPGSADTAPLLWRGGVQYDARRSAPFWAHVRVSVPQEGFYAAKDLTAGHVITPADIVHDIRLVSPLSPKPVVTESVLIGFECRRAIRAGTPMQAELLTRPRAVSQGDSVQVIVESGSAQVEFEGRALAAGRQGDSILVENTQNGKRLKALVKAPGQAIVQVSDSNDNQNSARVGTRAGNLRRPALAGGAKVKETGIEFARPVSTGR